MLFPSITLNYERHRLHIEINDDPTVGSVRVGMCRILSLHYVRLSYGANQARSSSMALSFAIIPWELHT